MNQLEVNNKTEILNRFLYVIGENTAQRHCGNELMLDVFPTPLGEMLSLSNERYLYLLEFTDKKGLDQEVKQVIQNHSAVITLRKTSVSVEAQNQLQEYFSKQRTSFSLPLFKDGTAFQKKAWNVLEMIPFGKTLSYQEEAAKLGNTKLVRAVGNANGANKLAIVIPCHRVIRSNGELGGYAGGIERKIALLQLEKQS
ncbi:methylated-DNA--[protein]-cysteine S-methyltransferase [Liquorilactobacillus aquaticus]|nr:methylated-DNA--[protein]-cysteine S-methyltransferase [Liquorilactobacillus aquaticus]